MSSEVWSEAGTPRCPVVIAGSTSLRKKRQSDYNPVTSRPSGFSILGRMFDSTRRLAMNIAAALFPLLVALAALVFAAEALPGQIPGTGAMTGLVRDPAGLVVANAAVSAINESTEATRSATTNASRVFAMTLLSQGRYSFTVSVPGFEADTLHGVAVVVGETSSLQFGLSIKNTLE